MPNSNPVNPSFKNPEINHSQKRLGNDAKWDKRIADFRKKRDDRTQSPVSTYTPDQKGEKVVEIYDLLKDLGGLGGLKGRPVGFSVEEHGTFTPATINKTDAAGTDGVLLPHEMKQSIANCYWAAAYMACLERHPGFINKNVKKVPEGSRPGLDPSKDWYDVTVYPRFMGIRHKSTVTVANDFPYSHLSPIDGLTDEDRLHAMLYEKAFAMWQGGYDELAWGNAGRTLGNMTGKRARYLLVPVKSEEAVWKSLNKKMDRQDAAVAIVMSYHDYVADLGFLPESIREDYREAGKGRRPGDVGLVNKHCYSITGAAEEKVQKTITQPDGTSRVEDHSEKVVYLRDPRNPATPKRVRLEDFCKVTMVVVSAKVKEG